MVNKMNCCICKGKIEGFGNNAEPVKEGTCCNECNEKIVIPIRILKSLKEDFEELKGEE